MGLGRRSLCDWGYALFEIPGGWMGDRFGPRIILTRIVLWWSAFTALTGAVSSYPLLVLTRLGLCRRLLDLCRARCFNALTDANTQWILEGAYITGLSSKPRLAADVDPQASLEVGSIAPRLTL